MASYVDEQVAAYRKVVGDAVAGKGLRDGIRQLQEKSKVRDTLKDLPARGAIVAKRNIGRRKVPGVGSPFNETSRVNYDETLVYSSSGLFVFRYAQIRTLNFSTPGGDLVVNFRQQGETA